LQEEIGGLKQANLLVLQSNEQLPHINQQLNAQLRLIQGKQSNLVLTFSPPIN
jgi:hypothetical protein